MSIPLESCAVQIDPSYLPDKEEELIYEGESGAEDVVMCDEEMDIEDTNLENFSLDEGKDDGFVLKLHEDSMEIDSEAAAAAAAKSKAGEKDSSKRRKKEDGSLKEDDDKPSDNSGASDFAKELLSCESSQKNASDKERFVSFPSFFPQVVF